MTTQQMCEYVTGGRCVFTLQSTKIDKRYTYKIRADKKNANRMYVDVLFGPDNMDDYRFIGFFYKDDFVLRASKRETVRPDDNRFLMIKHFLRLICTSTMLPDTCKFYPSGRCARCGRLLTTPESIESGFGPECIKYKREVCA